mmetsp:Transcript_22071/g.83954  ORF Transcript_22071/g.83954 Transcript_22071/m.83954 type:complete len:267 (-) Transcript_22071:236-1036(-)
MARQLQAPPLSWSLAARPTWTSRTPPRSPRSGRAHPLPPGRSAALRPGRGGSAREPSRTRPPAVRTPRASCGATCPRPRGRRPGEGIAPCRAARQGARWGLQAPRRPRLGRWGRTEPRPSPTSAAPTRGFARGRQWAGPSARLRRSARRSAPRLEAARAPTWPRSHGAAWHRQGGRSRPSRVWRGLLGAAGACLACRAARPCWPVPTAPRRSGQRRGAKSWPPRQAASTWPTRPAYRSCRFRALALPGRRGALLLNRRPDRWPCAS